MNVIALMRAADTRRKARAQYERRMRALSTTENDLKRAGKAAYEVHGAIVILDRAREQELRAPKLNAEGWW